MPGCRGGGEHARWADIPPPQSRSMGPVGQGWGWLCPSLSPEHRGGPAHGSAVILQLLAAEEKGSCAHCAALGGALRGAERALDRHDIPDGSLAARSAGVIVSFQSRLSLGAGSCPSTAHSCRHTASCRPSTPRGTGRAPHGLAVARGLCSISGPTRHKAGGHIFSTMARSWRPPPLGTLALVVRPQEASRYL